MIGVVTTTHPSLDVLEKVPSGIKGLDEVLAGGLPKGRPTLVCGDAGSGKTLFALEFLLRGALQCGEPGVFIAFEETPEELARNVASLGYDVQGLAERGLLLVDHVRVDRADLEVTGEYDLEGLFVRIDHSIKSVGAKRIVLDTVESLFMDLPTDGVLRRELRRLFRWLKSRGLTAVITGERGSRSLTREGLEEFVSDCVIFLDHRVDDQLSTRRLRVVKYRGSAHGTNEYPFLIDHDGVLVVPITSVALDHPSPTERVSSGIGWLDEMVGGSGYYRGSTVLVSGTTGTGKTTVALAFAEAACRRGERVLYITHEESSGQLMRNTRSVGLDLQPCVDSGRLRIDSTRPALCGLEMHLARAYHLVDEHAPQVVVIDPVTSLRSIGSGNQVAAMVTRLSDHLKRRAITSLFVSLIDAGAPVEQSDAGVSSLIDTWIVLGTSTRQGARHRTVEVLKSRGMSHSNRVREFVLTPAGPEIAEQGVRGHARRTESGD